MARKYDALNDLLRAAVLVAQAEMILRLVEDPKTREALKRAGLWALVPDRHRDYSGCRG